MYEQPELTIECAEQFEATLKGRIAKVAAETIDEWMHKHLASFEIAECIELVNKHLNDAIDDMPVWDIAKRTEDRLSGGGL